jgi:XTP/dITP diphosphohydrolase
VSLPRVVLATRNAHKVVEVRRILAEHGVDVDLVGTEAFPDLPDVAETGDSFEANALLKARETARLTGLPALADDSGLCVDALHGMPGIFSALGRAPWRRPRQPRLVLAQLETCPRSARRAVRVRRRRRAPTRPRRRAGGVAGGPRRLARPARAGTAGEQRLRLRPDLRPRGPHRDQCRAAQRRERLVEPSRRALRVLAPLLDDLLAT